MKQVCVNRWSCSVARLTTASALLPTLVTAMPEPKSISELPSTSSRTPPPARVTNTGRVVETPSATVSLRRANSSRERGPGISVTSRRSCGTDGPPTGREEVVIGRVLLQACSRVEDRQAERPRLLSTITKECPADTWQHVGGLAVALSQCR